MDVPLANPKSGPLPNPIIPTGFHLLIDLFTYKLFVIYAPNRKSIHFVKGMKNILEGAKFIPHTLITDKDQCYRSNIVNDEVYKNFSIWHNEKSGGVYHGK